MEEVQTESEKTLNALLKKNLQEVYYRYYMKGVDRLVKKRTHMAMAVPTAGHRKQEFANTYVTHG